MKLTYLAGRGRAEVIRMVFKLAGQDFVDNRISEADWINFKPSELPSIWNYIV